MEGIATLDVVEITTSLYEICNYILHSSIILHTYAINTSKLQTRS